MPNILSFPFRKVEFRQLARRIQPPQGLIREDWDTHPNGGGWVQKTAFVSITAYIGPDAIVSGEARVLDYARVVDEASVTGLALVAGKAVIGGQASVGGEARIFGTAEIAGNAQVGGIFSMSCEKLTDGTQRPLAQRTRTVRRHAVQLQFTSTWEYQTRIEPAG